MRVPSLKSFVALFTSNIRYKEDDEVVLVTFDSITERVYVRNNENPRISDLRKMSIKCRGCTSMSGVIAELRKALGKICRRVCVLLISHI